MPPLTGGVTAPTNIGLGQAAPPRAARRRAKRPVRGYDRQQKIMEAIGRAQQGRTLPSSPQPGIGPLPVAPGQRRLPQPAAAPQLAAAIEGGARARSMQGAGAGGRRVSRARKVQGANAPELGRAERPGLGPQLSRLLAAGGIDEGRARKTRGERSDLREAFGKDWRQEILGDGPSFREMRDMLAQQEAAGQVDPNLQAQYSQAVQKRLEAVERARGTLKRRRAPRRQVETAEAV